MKWKSRKEHKDNSASFCISRYMYCIVNFEYMSWIVNGNWDKKDLNNDRPVKNVLLNRFWRLRYDNYILHCFEQLGQNEAVSPIYTSFLKFISNRGRQWCGIIHYHWWTASIELRLLFSRAGYASWGLSLSSV